MFNFWTVEIGLLISWTTLTLFTRSIICNMSAPNNLVLLWSFFPLGMDLQKRGEPFFTCLLEQGSNLDKEFLIESQYTLISISKSPNQVDIVNIRKKNATECQLHNRRRQLFWRGSILPWMLYKRLSKNTIHIGGEFILTFTGTKNLVLNILRAPWWIGGQLYKRASISFVSTRPNLNYKIKVVWLNKTWYKFYWKWCKYHFLLLSIVLGN